MNRSIGLRFFVVLLVIAAACAGRPMSDQRVVRKTVAMELRYNVVFKLMLSETVYRLHAESGLACEVDSTTFATAAVGQLHLCAWDEPTTGDVAP